MSTKVASLFAEIGVQDKASEALKAINQYLQSTYGYAGLAASAVLAAGVAVAVGLNKAKDAAQEYDQQVKSFMASTGLSADAASRLIQTADDAGISFDTLNVAMRMAQKKGIEPSIESLAKLSDQYLKLAPGAERAQFLIDKFGRSGLDMARFMELGSEQLLKMNGAIEQGLVLTNKAIQESEEYRKNVDHLNDSWQGFKVTVGNQVIPVLNDLIDAQEKSSSAMDKATEITGRTDQRSRIYLGAIIAEKEANIAATDAVAAHGDALDGTVASYDAAATAASEFANEITTDYSKILDLTDALTGASDEQTRKLIYNMFVQKLSIDGVTDSEYKMAIAAGVALGIFSEKTANEALAINDLTNQVISGKLSVDALGVSIAALQDRTITVTTILQTVGGEPVYSGGQSAGGIIKRRAGGGPASGWTLVGEQGPELLNLPSGSSVMNNRDTMRAMGGNNFYINISADYADPETIANRLKPAVTRVMREAGVV